MGKRVSPNLLIVQKGIGFRFYQRKFFNDHPEFKPDKFCRKAIDEQIRLIAPEYIPDEETID